jgi:thiamine kinase-like enzyme
LELIQDAEDLHEYHMRTGRFSTAVASVMGDAMGTIHSQVQLAAESLDSNFSPRTPPWALNIHRPHLSIFTDASEGKLELIRIVQESTEFCDLLDELRRDWNADRLIHWDVKWSNWVTPIRISSARRVKLVDWELAALGDPCWDIGSAFSSYLSFWLSSIPITGQELPHRFLELSRYPLERMQPAIRSFWESYVRHMNFDCSTADQWLNRSVRYAAARLVQTAFEQMQRSSQVTGNVAYSLQLSLNMLRRPRETSVLLLGIPMRPMT